jgi:L-2-hydroxyglutarate oxidase LhgO
MHFDFVVIGGGIVGLATARSILAKRPRSSLVLLEKEPGPGRHQSTHNSGVLHAGLYYKPGSLKARLAVSGIRKMTDYCVQKGISHEICGKLVVATDKSEIDRLEILHQRGTSNGLLGIKRLGPEQIKEIEPHAVGIAALYVPQEGIVDYNAVCGALLGDVLALGGVFIPNARVTALHDDDKGWRATSEAGEYTARYLVNCAGLFCDRIARLAGVKDKVKIVPFRGEYFKLTKDAEHLVNNLIYPVPDPKFPFLGVHFTRLVHGGIEAGPNAVLAFAREAYRKYDFSFRDTTETFAFSGLWNFLRRYPGTSTREFLRSFSKELFAESLRKLVPAIKKTHLSEGGSGVRAQAMLADGSLVEDFWLVIKNNALHVLNAPSPAATASLAIADHLEGLIPSTK